MKMYASVQLSENEDIYLKPVDLLIFQYLRAFVRPSVWYPYTYVLLLLLLAFDFICR